MPDIEIDLNSIDDPARAEAYKKATQAPRRGVEYTSADGELRVVKYARPVGKSSVMGLDLDVEGKPGYWLDAPKGGIGTRFIDVTERNEG